MSGFDTTALGSIRRTGMALVLVVAAGPTGCDAPDPAPTDGVPTASAASAPTVPTHVLDTRPSGPGSTGLDSARMATALAMADSLPRLRCLVVARHGEILAERCRRGFRPDGPTNVKSVSKSVLSALVGIAIDEGVLEGVDQPVAPLLAQHLEPDPDSLKLRITVGDLLAMQSGLERTSGGNYGAWVSSGHWVRNALQRPMVGPPGGERSYSTGNYHLLSALLTEQAGESTLAFARSRLGESLGIRIPGWTRDPQGIYMGGNNMRLSPRAMIRFGELYRNEGEWDGERIVSTDWVRRSLEPRTRSRWSGEAYGYGWFLGDAGGHPMFYAWGYGGQFVFVVPALELTVAVTSDPDGPRGRSHRRAIHEILDRWIVPAAEAGA